MSVKTITHTTRSCDMCGGSLMDLPFAKNDGSFQLTYMTFKEKDFCFNCAGKLFTLHSKRNDIDEELLNKDIEYIRHGIGSFRNTVVDLNWNDPYGDGHNMA